jgi:hypothetical protein
VRIGLAFLLSLMTLAGCGPSPEDIAACRKQFADQTHAMREHGYPGHKGFTPRMNARWHALYAEFARLDGSASADACKGRLQAMDAEVRNLEAVLHKIDDYDVARMTRRAEADLDRTAQKQGASYATDYVLITLLRTMHERGAEAQKALAPLVARADAAKPGAERAAAMVALYNTAASNAAFADFKEAMETVENYDFDKD